MRSATLLVLLLLGCSTASGQPGTLDGSFGSGGVSSLDVGVSAVDEANDVAIQPDGLIVTVGSTLAYAGSDPGYGFEAFLVTRTTATGDPDPSFGTGGAVWTPVGTHAVAWAVVLQPDGRILVAGRGGNGYRRTAALVRYESDGTLDPSFGDGGIVTTSAGWYRASANDVVLLPDGRILITGYGSLEGSPYSNAIAIRYQPDGTLDSTFGAAGVAVLPHAASASGLALALQPDGRALIAGTGFLLARVLTNGALDESFGSGGIVSASAERALDVLVQPDGRVATVGQFTNGGEGYFAIRRFEPEGTPDSSYGTNGRVITDFPEGMNDQALAAVLLSDGRLIAAGTTQGSNPSFSMCLSRYTTSGSPDLSFGDAGRVAVSLRGDDRGSGVALVGDAIVVSGTSRQWVYGGAPDVKTALLQFTSTGVLDSGFGDGGVALGSGFGPGPDVAVDVASAASGTVIAGTTHTGESLDIAVVRLTHDGTPDPTFGDHGVVTTAVHSASDERAVAVVTRPEGAIVVGATSSERDGGAMANVLVQYTESGDLDTSFGSLGIVTVESIETLNDLILDASGRLVATGRRCSWPTCWGVVARFLANGAPDPAFGGGDGVATVPEAGAPLFFETSAQQPDGAYVVAGRYFEGFDTLFGVARITADGALDTTFGTGGVTAIRILTDVYEFTVEQPRAIAVQADGRIVVAGNAHDYDFPEDHSAFVAVRLAPDGSLDPSFGGDGIVEVGLGQSFGHGATSLALQTDGRLVLGGSADIADYVSAAAVLRLLPDGRPDSTFGVAGSSIIPIGLGHAQIRALTLQADQRVVAAAIAITDRGPDFTALRLLGDEGTPLEPASPVASDAISGVRPNPASGLATIGLTLQANRHRLTMELLDLLGRRVALLHDGPLGAGSHDVRLDATSVSAGIYVLRVRGEGLVMSRMMAVSR